MSEEGGHLIIQDREALLNVGRLSIIDLFVLTSLDQLLLRMKNIIYFFTKQASLMRSSTVLSLYLPLVFPVLSCFFDSLEKFDKNVGRLQCLLMLGR